MKKLLGRQKNNQQALESQSLYTETNLGNSATPAQEIPSKELLPLTCSDFSMFIFIQAYCKGNFEPVYALMLNDKDKPFRWRVILEEWSWLMKNEDGEHLFQIQEQILVLSNNIAFVKHAVYYIGLCLAHGKKPLATEVEKLNNLYPADYTDIHNVNLASSYIETKDYELSILQDEYDRLQLEAGTGEAMTEERIYQDMAVLGKHMNHYIDEHTVSPARYAGMYQTLLTDIKNSNKPQPADG